MAAPLPPQVPSGIALFDLDGTLIPWDCQILFRHFILRREPWRGIFLPVFLVFVPFSGLLGDETMKRIFLSYLWKMEPGKLDAYAREFAAAVMPAIYPGLKQDLENHHRVGHFLILASASPEFYVRHIGRELGFDLTLGTQVETGGFFPDLENHKGSAKVKRLHQELPASWFENGMLHHCRGYTDSRADLPMLALCQTATVVNPSAELTRMAQSSDWKIVRPARPWRTRWGFFLRVAALVLGLGEDPGGIRK